MIMLIIIMIVAIAFPEIYITHKNLSKILYKIDDSGSETSKPSEECTEDEMSMLDDTEEMDIDKAREEAEKLLRTINE